MNDRERLIELFKDHNTKNVVFCDNCFDDTPEEHDSKLLGLADYLIAHGVAVQRHGRWVTANDGTHFCSECGCDAAYAWDEIDRFFISSADDVPDRISDYCPNCGAKMDGETNDR